MGGDPLAESWTHADGLIGNSKIGKTGKADILLECGATHMIVLEVKLFSKLSPGVLDARYLDQAARYATCITEMLYRVMRSPESFIRLGFYVLAPKQQINAGVFKSKKQRSSILNKVQRRVEAYLGEKEKWFKEWFLLVLDRLNIRCISWEKVLDYIKHKGTNTFYKFSDFYNKCLKYNRPPGH